MVLGRYIINVFCVLCFTKSSQRVFFQRVFWSVYTWFSFDPVVQITKLLFYVNSGDEGMYVCIHACMCIHTYIYNTFLPLKSIIYVYTLSPWIHIRSDPFLFGSSKVNIDLPNVYVFRIVYSVTLWIQIRSRGTFSQKKWKWNQSFYSFLLVEFCCVHFIVLMYLCCVLSYCILWAKSSSHGCEFKFVMMFYQDTRTHY